jgi:serine/threonine-protein kinase
MGEVYRARDRKLNRDVAIKVLPERVATDPERLARFHREAQLLAVLNHVNIAAIYGFEDADSNHALVMELVDGPTLADRIAQGPIPIDEALLIARQIAAALEAAHEQGIIHRDLKPANIKVRADGAVKVLDFGLAKLIEPASPDGSAAGVGSRPTVTSPAAMTVAGIVLGTAPYMSPEQARGRAVDKRTDIWAFGCVVFEMLAGVRAFDDDDVSSTIAKVLRAEPDFELLPADVPPHVRQALRLCLRKDPNERLAHIRDARLAIDGAFDASAGSPAVSSRAARRWLVAGLVATALAAGVTIDRLIVRGRPITLAADPIHFEHVLPEGSSFRTIRRALAISPDGRRFVYNTTEGLYVREIDGLAARLLVRTAGSNCPVFSPDGQSIAYERAGALMRIPIAGGEPVPITTAKQERSGGWDIGGVPSAMEWESDGAILYGEDDGIWRVSANGGTPTRVVEAHPGEHFGSLQVLPGAQWLLLTSDGQVVAQSVRDSVRRVILEDALSARYVAPGFLLYLRVEGGLYAVAFDAVRLETHGGAKVVIPDVSRSSQTSEAEFDVGDDGSMVYIPGSGSEQRSLIWVDRAGAKVGDTGVTANGVEHPALSPDARFIAYSAMSGPNRAVFRYDTGTATTITLSAPGIQSDRPTWSPDGVSVAYNTMRRGDRDIAVRRADGTGDVQSVIAVPGHDWLGSWSRSGGFDDMVYDRGDAGIFYLERPAGGEWSASKPFLKGQAGSVTPAVSPNGRYVAFTTREPQDIRQVEVAAFPSAVPRWRISGTVGRRPRWSRDGTELFYVQDNDLMVVHVSPTGDLNPGRAQRLFTWGGLGLGATDNAPYDVSPDGKRFLVIAGPPAPPAAVRVIVHWTEELKRLLSSSN